MEPYEPSREKTCIRGFRPGPILTEKKARGLKFQLLEAEGVAYLFRERKGADQHYGFLAVVFCIFKKVQVFS